MFGNYLATALSNLARNWLYAAISIFGLAVSFAGGILVAQFVRNEFSYDKWIPGYEDVYKLTTGLQQPGQPPIQGDIVFAALKKELKDQYPAAIATARLMQAFPTLLQTPDSGDGGTVDETFAWADPEFIQVFPLPTVQGDLKGALDQPDTVILTQSAARKYFGREDVVGQSLTIVQNTPAQEHRPLKVTAVLKDYPSNTTLVAQIIATGVSSYAPLRQMDFGPDGKPRPPVRTGISTQTYVRLSPGTTPEQLQSALDVAAKPYAEAFANIGAGIKASLSHVPLADNHLTDPGLTNTVIKPPGSRATALAIAAVGALIVLVAGINFVTLMTARASRRAVEVGVRKANGATRGHLVVQFLGEALIYAFLSMLIAVGLASLLAQPFSDFVQRGLKFDFAGDPLLAGGLLLATLVIGVLGGFYPALVLSSFKPGTVLKGGQVKSAASPVTRQGMVVVQFAILIGLIISTVTIYQQTRFALGQGLGSDADLIMQVRTNCANAAFLSEVRKLPGVERAACSSMGALSVSSAKQITTVTTTDGRQISFDLAPVHFEFFETYNIKPLAGRVFERNRGVADNPPQPPFQPPPAPGQPAAPQQFRAAAPVILNETAIKALGYTPAQEAAGKQMTWNMPGGGPAPVSATIIGVIPDLPVSVSTTAAPAIYWVVDGALQMLSIRARADYDLASTVSDVQRIWKTTNNPRPIQLTFYSDYRRIQYLDIIIQGTLIGICAAAAVVIACLGLFASPPSPPSGAPRRSASAKHWAPPRPTCSAS